MTRRSKRFKKGYEQLDGAKSYRLEEAIEKLKDFPAARFDESVEISLRLGVDPKKSDQQVRNTVMLPHGTGKKIRVVVLATGEKLVEATEAGADRVGDQDLIEEIKNGWTDFDVLITTPEMMRELVKFAGRVLGPRGLMPNPKVGTVTQNIKQRVEESKKGKIQFKIDKNGVINNLVGKISFKKEQLVANMETLLLAVFRSKPATAKGAFFQTLFVSSTMGPGLKIDLSSLSLSI